MTSPSSLYILNYKTENPLTTLGFSGKVPDGPIDRPAYAALRVKDPNRAKLPSWERLVRIAARYREAFASTGPNDPCAVSRSVLSYHDAQSFLARRRVVADPPLAEKVNIVTQLGSHLHTKGRYPEGIECYDVVLQYDPVFRKARYGRALAYGQMGGKENLAKEETELRGLVKEVEDVAPETFSQDTRYLFALIYSELGGTLHRRDIGPSPEVIALFERSLQFDPSMARTYYNYGRYLRSVMDDPAKAVEQFDRALALDPSYAHARLGRGQALRKLGRQDEAEAALKNLALDVAANVSIRRMAFESLSDMSLEQKQWNQAFQYGCVAIEMDGNSFYGYANAADAAEALGRLAEARIFRTKALSLDPKYLGKPEEVEKVREKLRWEP